MTPREIADACRARGCCPLGAAMGKLKMWTHPMPMFAADQLGIPALAATGIANAWDDGATETAVLKAQALGLGPRIEAFLRGEGQA